MLTALGLLVVVVWVVGHLVVLLAISLGRRRRDLTTQVETGDPLNWAHVRLSEAAIHRDGQAFEREQQSRARRYEAQFQAWASLKPWQIALCFTPDDHPTQADILTRYKQLAVSAHPDHGGSHEQMVTLQGARDAALKECV
ncbi:MAG: hypothetical protein NUW22_13575 [Acidobacteria bacterium]|nr:hypothetical protein [Acidobacteriota bacterium]